MTDTTLGSAATDPDARLAATSAGSGTADDESALGSAAAAPVGYLLGGVFGAVAKLRRAKPLHPKGRVGTGTFEVTEPRPELEIPAFAATGRHPVTVRWSRSVGLPQPLPDIEGLAVRFEDLHADLLFSGSGTGRFGRYVFFWPRDPLTHGPMSTALPVPTGVGATLFLVRPEDESADGPPTRYSLAYATPGSEWRTIGVLEATFGDDRPIRFDTVRNALPGSGQYAVVRWLREPSYVMARRSTRG